MRQSAQRNQAAALVHVRRVQATLPA